MNYEAMSDFEINTKAAYKRGLKTSLVQSSNNKHGTVNVEFGAFNPCNDPADAWPIIVENKIAINPCYSIGGSAMTYESTGKWCAEHFDLQSDQVTHENPLRAAMIVFLMMQEEA